MECTRCGVGLDHCHGTLVFHDDGATECMDESCRDLDRLRHDLVTGCDEIVGGCACTESPALAAVA
jgi:hypothetical protein